MTGIMLIAISFVIIFRILIEKFCNNTEYKKRLAYAVGMMLCYTAVLLSIIYITGEYIISPVTDFQFYLCATIFAINLVFIFFISIYCSTAKKRSLSSKEKIKLKDL